MGKKDKKKKAKRRRAPGRFLDAASAAREHFEIFNRQDFDRGAALLTDDTEWINVPFGSVFRGPEGYRQFNSGWITAFPDARTAVRNVFGVGEWAAVEFEGIGTNDGPLKGPAGEIPATHRPVRMSCCQIFRVKDGKVASSRLYFDQASMMKQLGLAP